ncbi:MAG: hypothetical protein JWM95_4028 [Gemmatimonadetes bacterium]|nr:hypothetical protein [Gemmatimonadota bacterium]
MTDTREERLARIRARAKEHGDAMESATWFTAGELAKRWGIALTTVYEIPIADLFYKRFGKGQHPVRRYPPAAVMAFESADAIQQSA